MTKRLGSYTLLPTLLLFACQGDKDDTASAVEERSPWEIPSVVGVSNMDDDDENGTDDWADEGVAEDNDLSLLELPAALFEGGGVLHLSLSGDTEQIRIWHDGEILLDANTLETEFQDAQEDIPIEIEKQELYRPKRGALSISKARELLGFDPKYSLEDGVAKYVDYYHNHVLSLK